MLSQKINTHYSKMLIRTYKKLKKLVGIYCASSRKNRKPAPYKRSRQR